MARRKWTGPTAEEQRQAAAQQAPQDDPELTGLDQALTGSVPFPDFPTDPDPEAPPAPQDGAGEANDTPPDPSPEPEPERPADSAPDAVGDITTTDVLLGVVIPDGGGNLSIMDDSGECCVYLAADAEQRADGRRIMKIRARHMAIARSNGYGRAE